MDDDDTVPHKAYHGATPQPIDEAEAQRERERDLFRRRELWYEWERTRNAARRKHIAYLVIGWIAIAIFGALVWVGAMTVILGLLEWLGWL